MERIRVYQILDGERDYQDEKWTESNALNGIPDKNKSVSEWIGFMEYHINKAKNCVYNIDQQGALAEIRKITALGVKTMECLGCPPRERLVRHKRVFRIPIDDDLPIEDVQAYVKRISEEFKNNYSTTFEGELVIPDSDITFPEKKCDCKTPCCDDSCDCGDTQHNCDCKE